MSETENRAKLADLLANDVFSTFLWKSTGSRNQNWPCEQPQMHDRQTHPSDIVFYYDEPYSVTQTYVNCDLKSYKRSSITAGAILSAMESLSVALACAEISDDWRKKYIADNVTPSIVGLLFVYNHDGEYDKNFDQLLNSLNTSKVKVPRGSRMFVLGPGQIQWLDNVRYDIRFLRGNKELPFEEQCRFYYPELVRKKKVQPQRAKAATLEMITGPWIIVEHGKAQNSEAGYLVYYRHRGGSAQEFLYLIDYLMHYQMVREDATIRIKLLDPDPNASAHFKRAILEYIDSFNGGEEIAEQLQRIKYESIHEIHTQFSEIEVGMIHG